MYLYHIFVYVLFCLFYYYENCSSESVHYMDTERPVTVYTNKVYVTNYTLTALRVSRKDPRHYVNLSFSTTLTITNDIKIDFYFFQLISMNRYRPSFIELHFGICDFIDKEPLMGSQLKRNFKLVKASCPYPPGSYDLKDMAIPYVPKDFPFQRGRIYGNVSLNKNDKIISLARCYIDLEIKQMIVNKT